MRTTTLPLLALALTGAAHADILLLKDGRLIQDRPLERTDDHVVVTFQNGEVRVPAADVEEIFLDSELDNLPSARRSWLKKELEKKQAEIAASAEHGEWRNAYEQSSKYFDWKYTITPSVGKGMQDRFDKYYDYFKKAWKLKPSKQGKMLVNFYKDSKQYERVAGAPPGALAYFRFVAPYDLNACYDRLDPVTTEQVLYHELSHYVQKLIDEDFKMPHWPGEGISEYYGGARWDEEKGDFEWNLLQEQRLVEVKQDMSLDKFLTISEIVMEPAYTDYTWGWALIHFLMQDSKRADQFTKYILGLARDKKVKRVPWAMGLSTVEGDESLRYFMDCLKLKDDAALQDLQRDFYTYLEGLEQTSASGKEKAAIAAMNTGKRLRAKRLFQEARDGGGLTALGCHNYARLVRFSDKKLARELYTRATELDPLTGTYWYRLSQLMDADTEKAEAERLKKLALELDADVESQIELTFVLEGVEDD